MKELIVEEDLASMAKLFRKAKGKKRAQAARDMKVSQTAIFHAEESPEQSLSSLRIRMIEAYAPYHVTGPLYRLKPK